MMMMAVGDALAGCLIERKGLTAEDFSKFHPGGSIGKRLLAKVRDVMHSGNALPLVAADQTLKECLVPLSAKGMGAVVVVDDKTRLLGIFTDGDLRRALNCRDELLNQEIASLMTKDPLVCAPTAMAWEAMRMMEDRPSQISLLPVVDSTRTVVGIIRIHDLVRYGFRNS